MILGNISVESVGRWILARASEAFLLGQDRKINSL